MADENEAVFDPMSMATPEPEELTAIVTPATGNSGKVWSALDPRFTDIQDLDGAKRIVKAVTK